MVKDKIDVIIPAFKAHGTIIRCLSSIACQTIVEDVSVVIVNDCCPEGDYSKAVEMFSPVMDVREIVLQENSGPGVARQAGIDATDGEFFTCVDADDSLYDIVALKKLRDKILESKTCKCASGAFFNPRFTREPEFLCRQMVWMFGKLYRREWIDEYKIRFNNSRANEDTGFNHIVKFLCDNPEEEIRYVEEYVYYYHDNPESITRINNGQYYIDQCTLGGIDNMIYAIDHVRKYKPFSENMVLETIGCMTHWYCQYVRTLDVGPMFSIQLWEYIKKYYHKCYKPIEGYVTEDAFKSIYSRNMRHAYQRGDLLNIIPKISICDFMDRLHREAYDPHLIDEIREEMEADPQYQEIMKNNIACGVCPDTKEVKGK